MANEITKSEVEEYHSNFESLTECFEMFIAQTTYIECLHMNDDFFLMTVREYQNFEVHNMSCVFSDHYKDAANVERFYKFPTVSEARDFAFQYLVEQTNSYV